MLHAADISLVPVDFEKVAGRSMPVRWSIRIPGKQLDITTTALNPNAWMDLRIPYWEGPVRLGGSHAGQGYLEMTGY
ncbi:Hydroxyneurosporene synthase (CrtC) [compost metagenome]